MNREGMEQINGGGEGGAVVVRKATDLQVP